MKQLHIEPNGYGLYDDSDVIATKIGHCEQSDELKTLSRTQDVNAKSEESTLQERGLVIGTVCSGEKNINTILFKVGGQAERK